MRSHRNCILPRKSGNHFEFTVTVTHVCSTLAFAKLEAGLEFLGRSEKPECCQQDEGTMPSAQCLLRGQLKEPCVGLHGRKLAFFH